MAEEFSECNQEMYLDEDLVANDGIPENIYSRIIPIQPAPSLSVPSNNVVEYNCINGSSIFVKNNNVHGNNKYRSYDSNSLDEELFSNRKLKSATTIRKREYFSTTSKKYSKKFCSTESEAPRNHKDDFATKLQPGSPIDGSEVNQKNIFNSDLNDVYKGLLSDGIDSFPAPEVTRQKLKRLKRKDLEDLILEHIVASLLGDCKFGYQKDLCMRLEQNLEHAQKKITQLSREIRDLKRITLKLADEHTERISDIVFPAIIKRSVGVQVQPRYIDEYLEDELSSEEVAFNPPKPFRRKKTENGVNGKIKPKPKLDEDCENWSDMDDRNGYESLIDDSDTDEREEIYKQKLSELNTAYKYGNKIPRPTLSAKQKNNSIVLTWNTPLSTCQGIANFRLFSCQNDKLKSKKRWKIVGDVEPMELPMACTLTDFHPERTYHFAVRAINFKGESGPMSKSEAVLMS